MDITSLRSDIRSAGLLKHRELRTWFKFAGLLAGGACLIAAQLVGDFWLLVLLMPVVAFVATAAVMLGHEGGHRALSSNRFRNSLMLHLAFPVFSGLGASFWRWKHNQQHHVYPNVSGQDSDLQLWPMTTSREEYMACDPARRWFQRHCQGFMFWPLTVFLPLSLRVKTLRYMFVRVRTRGWDRELAIDAGCLVVHLVLWLLVPGLIVGLGPALAYWLGFWACVGVMLAMVFAPAHMGLPVYSGHDDPWRLQLETTRNLRLPAWLRFFFCGLDYQVEHHLFPNIPHQNLPATSAILRAWTDKHELAYLEIGYAAALVDVTRFMGQAWDLPAIAGRPRESEEVGPVEPAVVC